MVMGDSFPVFFVASKELTFCSANDFSDALVDLICVLIIYDILPFWMQLSFLFSIIY